VKYNLHINENMIRGTVLGLLAAAVVLVAAEKTAGWVEETRLPDPLTPGAFEAPQPFLLWELPPGKTEVNDQWVEINAMGMRGPDVTPHKAPNSRRIVFLGNNVTFGQGVELSETFAFDATQSLGGTRVGVQPVMMAVPDYTALQHLNLMDMRGWELNPDIVVVGGPGAEMTVQSYVDEDVISPYRSPTGLRSSLEKLALFRVFNQNAQVHSGAIAKTRKQVFIGKQNNNPLGLPRMTTNAYASALNQLVESAIARSVQIVFIVLPLPEDLTNSHLNDTVSLYRNAMSVVADRHGVPIVDGPTVFTESRRDTGQLFLNGTLLSAAGHRVLGYSLAKTIKPWMRGRKLMRQGTGEPLSALPEPESASGTQ